MKVVKDEQIANAIKWSAITTIMRKMISPVTNMVLARLLAPDIFGVVVTIDMVISFADLFTDAGFQKYIVQHEFNNEKELHNAVNVAFWTNLSLSILLWLAIAVFRESLAKLVGSEGYGLHLMVAALAIPLLSFSSIQQALFRRAFDYKGMFGARLANVLIPIFVTIPLAYFTRSCWALIIGTLASHTMDAILLTYKSKWKPKLIFSLGQLTEMLPFTIWTMFESFTIWMTVNIDVFILSRYLQPYYLGLYKTAITTVGQITNVVTSTVVPIMFAVLSRNQHDKSEFENTLYSFQGSCGILLIPMSVGIYIYRDVVTWVLLGPQWMEAADFIGMLGITQAATVLISNFSSEVYRAKGNPKVSAVLQIIYIIAIIPFMHYAAQKDFKTIYIARIGLKVIFAFMHLSVLQFKYRFAIRKMLQSMAPSLIACVPMTIVGIQLNSFTENMVLRLISILLCIIVYCAVCLIIPSSRNIILSIIKNGFVYKNENNGQCL